MAGRWLALNRSDCRKICPSVIEMTLVGNVGRDVVGLGLDDRQAGHRAAAQLGGELGTALQQPAVQVEHVAGIGLPAGRTTQQQRHGPVRLGLLGQVVEDDQHVLALVHPVLADRRAGVGGDVLVAGRVGRRRVHDGRVLHRARILQDTAQGSDGRTLLPDRHIDAAHLQLGVPGIPELFLVDDGVHRDGGLAGLAVPDDQLALATPDRDHRVDGLDPGLQWLPHLLAVHHTGRLQLERAAVVEVGDLAQAVDRSAEGVDHPAEVAVTDGHRQDVAGSLDRLALLDSLGVTHHDHADLADVEVEGDSQGAVLELQQLVGHG